MTLFRLTEEQVSKFTDQPETRMGIQICKVDEGDPIWILGGRVGWLPDDATDEIWSRDMKAPKEEDRHAFSNWLSNLPEYGSNSSNTPFYQRRWPVMGIVLTGPNPIYPRAPMPSAAAAGTYGHLPYAGATQPDDVFYRCESFPTSTRVVQGPSPRVTPRTFAAPISELPFMATGFSVLGRYAIPRLPPACYRWEIQPTSGTTVACGLAVPMFGYAGGGVEVEFTQGAVNRGPIANPVVLSPF
jgi:hypothetical protein